MTKLQQLAAFLRAHPNQWLGARELEFAGRQAWRTRVSDCRTQLGMDIENRVRRVRGVKDGRCYDLNISEYRYHPASIKFVARGRGQNPSCPGCLWCDGPDREQGECVTWPH